MKPSLSVVAAASPFPVSDLDSLTHGLLHKIPSACSHCKTYSCRAKLGGAFGHNICEFGLSFYPFKIGDDTGLFVGLIVTDKNSKVGGERRKALRKNWVEHDAVEAFHERLKDISSAVTEFGNFQTQVSLSVLHEIRSSVGVVLHNCEKLIQSSPGADLTEKIENADTELRNLFQSISLLREQLDLTDVIANPDSITYGRRHRSLLSGLFFKMIKLFEGRASKRGIRIQFHADSDTYFDVYNSFQLVPLILLDNAIKYSYSNKIIYVNIGRAGSFVEIAVSSFGDVVPVIFRDRIFDRFVRGPEAHKQAAEGMGLGLFIARQIVNAHGFSLDYRSVEDDAHPANNDFVLRIPLQSRSSSSGRKSDGLSTG